MRTSIWAAAVALATTVPAWAGVVITQEESVPDGAGATQTVTRTILIEGSKQKVTGMAGGIVQIIDVDAGTMTTLDPKARTAMQIDMQGMGAMVSAFAAQAQFDMKSTGGKKTIAGHACEEYSGAGKSAMGDASVVQCVAKNAPGAADYAAFQKKMMAKMGLPIPSGQPEGVVLYVETTSRASAGAGFPGLPPEIAKQLAEEQAKAGPQVSRTEVKSIKVESIPRATFEIPAGYEKQDMGDLMKKMQEGQ